VPDQPRDGEQGDARHAEGEQLVRRKQRKEGWGVAALALLLALIHPSAWKRDSANFVNDSALEN
jgi:hypothetical protein